MRISYNWLQTYFSKKLPPVREIADVLTMHAFEVEAVEKIGDDTIFEIDVLPNRAHDCLSHIGVAREVALLFGLELKLPPTFSQRSDLKAPPRSDLGLLENEHLKLEVSDDKLVPRATKQLIFDVQVKESPKWLKERLEAMGQKPINNIVDVTNFVMFETGQPVHSFDYDRIADWRGPDADSRGQKLMVVRVAQEGEKITTLDGARRTLDSSMLVIADSEKALDIAGIKGGENSQITEKTKRVVLSACNFNPISIRKTSRKLGLLTDASKRFEQGITPELAGAAMNRLTALVLELAGGKPAGGMLDFYPRPVNPYVVGVSLSEVNDLLGLRLSGKEVAEILDRLARHAGFLSDKVRTLEKILELAPKFVGTSYQYGASVSYDAPRLFDCSGFVMFLYRQAGVGIPRMSIDQYFFGTPVEKKALRPGDLIFSLTDESVSHKESKEFLPGQKVDEGISHVGLYLGDGKVIHTSTSKGVFIEDLDKSLAFKNLRGFRRIIEESEERFVVTIPHERLDLRLKEDLIEEIGRIYGYGKIKSTLPEKTKPRQINKIPYYQNKVRQILSRLGFSEIYNYSLVKEGEIELANPLSEDKKFLRQDLEAGLEEKLDFNLKHADLLGLDKIKIFEFGKTFTINAEKLRFALGIAPVRKEELKEVIKTLNKELRIDLEGEEAGDRMAEFDFEEIVERLPDPENLPLTQRSDLWGPSRSDLGHIYKLFSIYPFIVRDIALWVPNDTNGDEILKVIAQNSTNLLVNSRLFDVYSSDQRTSYAFRLVFQSPERTLTDDEVNKIMEQIYQAVGSRGWQVR